jgi:serine/threonine-protein kinase
MKRHLALLLACALTLGAAATRPPLYHDLLGRPTDVKDLEKGLNVDLEKAFLNDELVRAGVIQSGVSKQPRLLPRGIYDRYWKLPAR